MNRLPTLRRLWRNIVTRDRVERDLDDELRATIEILADEKMRAGMTAADAHRAAMIELGGHRGGEGSRALLESRSLSGQPSESRS